MDVDTIVSLSTPRGVGAIAVVRVSGPSADRILYALMAKGRPLPEARTATLVELLDPDGGDPLDRALVTRFVAPDSFTGEDLVELSCHGGWLVPELVVDACRRAGARLAEPGEFSKRAFLRGKLDLVQAEAIADLVEARSRARHRAAMGQLDRGLSRRISAMRERLVRVEALLAHHVDFPEEDDAPVPLDTVASEASSLLEEVDGMLRTAPEGEMLREGALVVLAGRTNAGKSSLYNALVGRERAIVTEEPGTTRDALECVVELDGYPFRLVDTAGLREAPGRVERLGIEIAEGYLERADVILYCVPVDEGTTGVDETFLAEERAVPVVLVETKADLGAADSTSGERPGVAAASAGRSGGGSVGPAGVVGGAGGTNGAGAFAVVQTSAESGVGLDRLRRLLPNLVYAAIIAGGSESPVLTRRRQARALETARAEVAAFREGLLGGLPPEVAATHLRTAETALEELLGVVSVDDVLDVVFREFCVGK